MSQQERAVIEAVRYGMRVGLFFPVREPRPGATPAELVRWGAFRHLHETVYALGAIDARAPRIRE